MVDILTDFGYGRADYCMIVVVVFDGCMIGSGVTGCVVCSFGMEVVCMDGFVYRNCSDNDCYVEIGLVVVGSICCCLMENSACFEKELWQPLCCLPAIEDIRQ